jgi:hypothetical protein
LSSQRGSVSTVFCLSSSRCSLLSCPFLLSFLSVHLTTACCPVCFYCLFYLFIPLKLVVLSVSTVFSISSSHHNLLSSLFLLSFLYLHPTAACYAVCFYCLFYLFISPQPVVLSVSTVFSLSSSHCSLLSCLFLLSFLSLRLTIVLSVSSEYSLFYLFIPLQPVVMSVSTVFSPFSSDSSQLS